MNNEISINITNELAQYTTQIQEALVSASFTDGDDNSELVQNWTVARPFECVMRLFVLANETDMVTIQNAIIEAIYNATGIRLTVNFVDGSVTWFDVISMPETVEHVVSDFIDSFDQPRKESIRKAWDNTNEDISYASLSDGAISWMYQNLIDAGNIAKARFERKNKDSNRTWQSAIIPHLEFEEHCLWLAELAHRAAPNNKEAQRWMLS